MANKTLFQSLRGRWVPACDTKNSERSPAYAFSPRHALAQIASTGCLNRTFYATAEAQLSEVLRLCAEVEPAFVAKTAVYARERGAMKDMPALLCAVLSVRAPELLAPVFARVIDNGKMLRTFVQVMRSGAVGRKSLGTRPKRLVQQWLAKQSDEALFCASVGNDPSLCDLVRMVHPKPHSEARARLYAYLTGRKVDVAGLPQLVRQYEDFKRGDTLEVPAVPFEMLTTLPLGRRDWCAVAERAGWQMTRMNLNTFARHGVFEEPGMTRLVAARLRNADLIAKARVFPYQLMVAYTMAGPDIPFEVREALQDALEIATANVPAVSGQVVVCPDVSGSMSSPVTGVRRGATSTVRCIDVAALVAASLLRKNPGTRVLPFEQRVVGVQLNGRDSVMTNARVLAAQGGGGTNCSAPLAYLNAHKVDPDLVVFVSDNESWVDAAGQRGTEMMRQWEALRQRYAKARLVCIDLVPNRTTQAVERADILNIGGFSDQVFEVVAAFARGELGTDHWVSQIEAVDLRAA